MPEASFWPFVVAGAAALLAGAVRGFSGFGSAMILTPALSAVWGPAEAVPIGLMMELLVTVPLLPGTVRLVEWRRIGALTLAAVVTLPLGTWLLLSVDPRPMRWAISGVVLGCVAMLAFGWRYRGRPRAPATLVAGAASGVLTGASGMGGPPIIFYYLSGSDPAGHARASFIVYFALIDAAAVAAFGLHGALTLGMAGRSALLAPLFLGAAWLGARGFGRASETFYRKAALAVLTAIAMASLAA